CALSPACRRRSHAAPFFRRLDRLAVQNDGAGGGFSPGLSACLFASARMDLLPGAIHPPEPERVVGRLPGRNIMGHQPPDTATAEDREDGIHDFPSLPADRTAAWLGR